MATFAVTTTLDVVNAGDGLVSLREAIVQANAAAEPSNIVFDPTLLNTTLNLTQGQLTITNDVEILGDINGDNLFDITISRDSNFGNFRIFNVAAGDVTFNGLTITEGHTVAENGGGVFVANPAALTLVNTFVSNNQVESGNGGGLWSEGTLTLDNTTVANNESDGDGGGISNSGNLTIINNSVFDNNLSNSGNGGGIFSNGQATVQTTTFNLNSALNGGGFFNGAGAVANFSHASFNTNSATQIGGGICNFGYAYGDTDVLLFNFALNGGGLANAPGAFFYIYNPFLDGNTATQDGGGILNSGRLTLIESIISNNSADSDAGGLFNNGSARVFGATFTGNRALYGVGGAIYNANPLPAYNALPNTLDLTNGTLAGNRAAFGGGVGNDGRAAVFNSTFSGNFASSVGGGFLNGVAGALNLTNSLVAGNAASVIGGDFFNSGGPTQFNGVNLFSQAGAGDAQDLVVLDLTNIFAQVAANPDTGILSGVLGYNGGAVPTIAILHGGAAFDAGDTSVLPPDTFDLNDNGNVVEPTPYDARLAEALLNGAGFPRVSGNAVDIGAFEWINLPPTLTLTQLTTSIDENIDYIVFPVADIKVQDIDGNGTNNLSLSGPDSADFKIVNTPSGPQLYFIVHPDFEAKASYQVTVEVDDPSTGGSPDASESFTLTVNDQKDGDTVVLPNGGAFHTYFAGNNYDAIVGGDGQDQLTIFTPGFNIDLTTDGPHLLFDIGTDGTTDLHVNAVEDIVINANNAVLVGDFSGTGLAPNTVTFYGDGGPNNFDASGMVSNENVVAFGYGSEDTLIGSGGDDVLMGGKGNDILMGGAGDDILRGGPGADSLDGGEGNDIHVVDHFEDEITEAAGPAGGLDVLWSQTIDLILASYPNVEKARLGGDQALDITANPAGAADVVLIGNAGANHLTGSSGNDKIKGGEGEDTIAGGDGRDFLYGGGGADTFVFNFATESVAGVADKIWDFSGVTEGGEGDRIDLRGLEDAFGQFLIVETDGHFHNIVGDLRFLTTATATHLQIDFDADNSADFSVAVVGPHAMSAADLFVH